MFGDSHSPFNRFLNFDEFFTIKFIRLVFIAGLILAFLSLVGSGLLLLVTAVKLAGNGEVTGVVTGGITLVFGMLLNLVSFAITIILWRMFCEVVIVAFKINENLQSIKDSRVMGANSPPL